MANTLGIPERTMAQIVDSTNSINVIGGTDGRLSAYQPLVVRITDHVRNDATETGGDADKMAIFTSARHGEPWKNDWGTEHILSEADDTLVNATVIFPDYDYSTFE